MTKPMVTEIGGWIKGELKFFLPYTHYYNLGFSYTSIYFVYHLKYFNSETNKKMNQNEEYTFYDPI